MTRAETEASVRACYASWSEGYHDAYYGPEASYPPVQRDLVAGLITRHGARSLLDAGCGPASFLRYLADTPIELFGFDLSPEMVDEARRVLAACGRDPRTVWQGSVVDPDAFHAPDDPLRRFDAAACVGVLPHVRPADEPLMLRNLRDALEPGGLLVLEARNALFALFTMNRYTKRFVDDELIRVDELAARAGRDASRLRAAVDDLSARYRMDLPPVRRGEADAPGYDEVLSRAHNPLTLPDAVTEAGFEDVRTLFYHYHCLPPVAEAACPALFRRESVAMEDPTDWRGHFMASAFLVTGRRA